MVAKTNTNAVIAQNEPSAADAKTSMTKVNGLIKAALTSYKKAHDAVQNAGLAIAQHAETYNDCSAAARLVRGIPANMRNSLVGWFGMYFGINVAIAKEAKDDRARFLSDDHKLMQAKAVQKRPRFDFESAKANGWWTDPASLNRPAPAVNLLDMDKVYGQVIGIFDRMIREAKKEDSKIVPEERDAVISQMEELKATVSRYHKRKGLEIVGGTETEPKGAKAPEAQAA